MESTGSANRGQPGSDGPTGAPGYNGQIREHEGESWNYRSIQDIHRIARGNVGQTGATGAMLGLQGEPG